MDASGAVLKTNKGFVETSGEHLATTGIRVQAKEWLLDPNDIEIGSTATTGGSLTAAQAANGVSQILASDISNALTTGTNVTIATSASATGGSGDITVNSAVSNTASGKTLTLNAHRHVNINNNITVSNLSLNAASGSVSGTGNLAVSGTTTINSATTGTLSGVISGGGLTKTGAGTTILTGINTYAGGSTVSSGTLQIGDGTTNGKIGSGITNIVSGATLDFNVAPSTSSNYSTTNTFTGSGTLKKTGTGVLTWGSGSAVFGMTGGLIDVQAGTFVGANSANEVWTNNKASLNVASGATFQGVEGAIVVDALTGGGTVSSGYPGYVSDLTVGIINGSGTFSGVIQDSNGVAAKLTKVGTGTQTLSGTNTYTGTTTISGGVLQVGDGGTAGNLGTGAVINNAALVFNRSDSHLVANAISGSGTLTKSGAGTASTTILTGANTYTGTTTISSGTLQIGNGSTTGTIGTGNVVNNSKLTVNRTDALATPFVFANNMSGSGSFVQAGTGATKITGVNNFSGGITISKGNLIVGNGGNVAASYNSTVGTGSITLGDANTGADNIGLYLDKGFGPSPMQSPLTRAITVTNYGTGVATIGGVSTSTSGSGWAAFGGPIVLNKSINVTDTTGDRIAFDGLVSGAGGFTLTAGRLIMGSAGTPQQNTFMGTVQVNSGTTLQLNTAKGLSAANKVINNGSIRVGGNENVVIDSLDGSTTGVITSFNLGSGAAASLSIGNNGGTGNYAGTIIETGAVPFRVIKNGTGTQTLTGANTYTGTTTINAGTLQIGNSGTSGTLGAGAVSVASGANLNFNRSDAFTVANNISGAGTVSQNGTGLASSTSNLTLTGDLSGETGTFNVNRGTMTFNALTVNRRLNAGAVNINNGSTVKITSGSGFLYAAGTNWNFDANGGGTIDASSSVNFVMGLGTTSPNNTFNTNGGATNNIIGAYTGGINTNISSSTTTFNVANGSSAVGLNVSADLWNAGSIVKTGAGLMQLTNVTPDATTGFSGTIAVNQGTLQVGNGGTSGYLGTGAVTLSGGANLNYVRSANTTINNAISGTGNVNATITGSGNALTVSKSIGLTHGNINLVTDSGDILVNQAIGTGNSATDTVALNAGKLAMAGNASGGNVIFSGLGAISNTSGLTTIMTGSVLGSTGLGVAAGNNRYNSDETATNYTSVLGATGKYAIYREAPTLAVNVNNATKTYDGLSYTGGNGFTESTTSGLKNGDALTSATAGAVYGGSAQGAKNASSTPYSLSASEGTAGKSALGYGVTYNSGGTLTINKAGLTVTAQAVTKTYDGKINATGTGTVGTLAGAGAGESVNSAGSQAYTDKNFGLANKTVKASGVTIKDSGNADVTSNYDITYADNTASTINKKSASVTAAGNSVIFNSQLQTDKVTTDGFIFGDNVGSVIGAGNGTQAGTYQSNLALTGNTSDISNYAVTYKNAAFTISAQNYVRPPVEITILSPVTFGLAFTGAATAAGGDGVDISSACDAWSSRGGGGSVSVMTLLKPSFMGLRTAKTDSMEAMSGGSTSSAPSDAGASPCGGAGSLAQK